MSDLCGCGVSGPCSDPDHQMSWPSWYGKKEKKPMLRPVNDFVLIKPSDAEKVSAGGIVIPDSAQEKNGEGVVVQAGPGGVTITGTPMEMPVKQDDRVLFRKHAAQPVTIEGVEYAIVRSGDIVGVFES